MANIFRTLENYDILSFKTHESIYEKNTILSLNDKTKNIYWYSLFFYYYCYMYFKMYQ